MFKKAIQIICIFSGLLTPVYSSIKNHPLTKIKISKNDSRFAKHFDDLNNQLRKNQFKNYTLNKAEHYASKSSVFNSYSNYIKWLKDINKLGMNIQGLIKKCNMKSLSQKPINDDPVLIGFREDIKKYCRLKFLSQNKQHKNQIKFFSSSEKNYLSENIQYYLRGDHKSNFLAFLGRIQKGTPANLFITELMANYYISENISINKSIVPHIQIDETLTKFIQSRGLIDKAAIKYFKEEFILLSKAITSAIQKGDNENIKQAIDQLIGFYSTNKKYISSERAIGSYGHIVKRLIQRGKSDLSIYMSEAAVVLSDHSTKNQALFLNIIALIRAEKNEEALFVIKKHKLLEQYEYLPNKLRYWVALALKAGREWDAAKYYFSKQIEVAPINYYSILSFKELQKFDRNINPNSMFIINQNRNSSNSDFYRQHRDFIYRVSTWIDIKNSIFIDTEVDFFLKGQRLGALNDRKIASLIKKGEVSRNGIILSLIEFLNSKKRFLNSFKVVYNSLDENLMEASQETLKFLFPLKYLEKIKTIDNEINPLIVLSLIRQESAFNPSATSRVGARGLMQLMPATAREISRKVKNEQLEIPDVNIAIGIKYFKKLIKKYEGNLIYSLAAYNAGEGNVDKWIRTRFTSEKSAELIEEIPFKETRNYVKLIYRNMFFYNILSNNKNYFSQKMDDTFLTALNIKR